MRYCGNEKFKGARQNCIAATQHTGETISHCKNLNFKKVKRHFFKKKMSFFQSCKKEIYSHQERFSIARHVLVTGIVLLKNSW